MLCPTTCGLLLELYGILHDRKASYVCIVVDEVYGGVRTPFYEMWIFHIKFRQFSRMKFSPNKIR